MRIIREMKHPLSEISDRFLASWTQGFRKENIRLDRTFPTVFFSPFQNQSVTWFTLHSKQLKMSVAQTRSMKRKRSSSWGESRYCYESPLNVFKKSLEELTSVVDNIVCKRNGRLTRGMQKRSKRSLMSSSKKSSSRNSVIVINDSDSEADDGANRNETDEIDEQNASVSVVECSSSKPTSPLQRKRKLSVSTEQNANVSSTVDHSLDNDLSVLCLSDTQDSSLDGENIAPSQTEDDVVELWSCLKDPSSANKNKKNTNKCKKNTNNGKEKKNTRCNPDETDAMFVIDKRRDLKYLKYLKADTRSPQKKKMKRDLISDKTMVESSVRTIEQRTLKHLDSGQRKKQCFNRNELQSRAKRTSLDENIKTNSKHKLREIIVDGCNVAMAHTNGKQFSVKGIQIVIDYFKQRGHVVKVFLPQHVRKKEYSFLEELYKDGTVIFTPSRRIGGRQITSYDDRFILKYATSCGGIVISSDQYRDLYNEKPEWRNTILNRLLIPTFVGDYIMFPEDPLGKSGPNLDKFLRH